MTSNLLIYLPCWRLRKFTRLLKTNMISKFAVILNTKLLSKLSLSVDYVLEGFWILEKLSGLSVFVLVYFFFCEDQKYLFIFWCEVFILVLYSVAVAAAVIKRLSKWNVTLDKVQLFLVVLLNCNCIFF